jgi:hypothetical protein
MPKLAGSIAACTHSPTAAEAPRIGRSAPVTKKKKAPVMKKKNRKYMGMQLGVSEERV